jgi:hypothetical protein
MSYKPGSLPENLLGALYIRPGWDSGGPNMSDLNTCNIGSCNFNPMESGLNAQYTAVKARFKIPLNDLTLVHRGRHTSLGFTVSAVRAGGTRHPTLVG